MILCSFDVVFEQIKKKTTTENPFENFTFNAFVGRQHRKKIYEKHTHVKYSCMSCMQKKKHSNADRNCLHAIKEAESARMLDAETTRAPLRICVWVRQCGIQFVTLEWRIDIVNVNKVNADIRHDMQ